MTAQEQAVARADPPRVLSAWRRRCRAAVSVLVFGGAGLLLFLAYLHESRTLPVNSDGAANALQAWDMLHGNALLHGWILTDVSFYTTELPQYMLVELARGLVPDVVHVAAAMTYTLLVLLAALLARGRATGWEAVARMLLAAGIMLAPTPGGDANVLLLSPDHTGTMVPLLVMWLILDRGGRRWYVPVLTGLILALATVADTVTLLECTVPVILVSLFRVLRDRRSGQSRRFELTLAGSAAASAVVGWVAIRLIHRSGGFTVHSLTSSLVTLSHAGQHAANMGKGLLVIFGSDFFGGRFEPNVGFIGLHRGPNVALSALHTVGLALAAWALSIAVRRFYRETEFVVAALAVGVGVVIAAYFFSGFSANFLNMREMAGVLPMTAVLAGRLLPGRLAAWIRARPASAGAQARPATARMRAAWLGIRRLAAAGAVAVMLPAGICYAATLAFNAARPSVSPQYQHVAAWLARHHLSYGIGGYWQASSITLETGGRIRVVAVRMWQHGASAGQWESQAAWYNPRVYKADFAVVSPGASGLPLAAVTRVFGPPAHTYRVAGSMVLTWHENLLTHVTPPPA